jgi:hypothetical protein
MGNVCIVLAGKSNEKRREGKTDIDGILILKLMLEGYCVKMWSGFVWVSVRTNGGLSQRFFVL